MKKSILILAILFSLFSFSQAITVDSSTYNATQLVNNILINSPCITATNCIGTTGTNYGSVNGIGYFQNTNPNFPMTSGVILSTGSVLNAPGPNTTMQSAGNAAWVGDPDLDATMAAAGFSMTSANATVLQFDFTPLSPNFDFSFLFASEEYGNFQCNFSDAFAFLLTNLTTGVTTNLAVVPGTTNPISVVTIRDAAYNSSCSSVNPTYFGLYNGGSNAAGSATNFNGQTVVMNASTVLTPNTPYRIKLVIADRTDYQGDSAIFLQSNSFNIGQNVLGNDHTIATNTALCAGQTQLLNTNLSPANFTFQWSENGTVIAGATGATYLVNHAGTYAVTYTNITFPCQIVTDSIEIQYYPAFVTPNPKKLYACNSGAATYQYDLSQNTPVVTAGLAAGTTVSYFISQSDADANSNPLPLNYTSAPNQTIYVRINNGTTGCYVVKTFQLLTSPAPTANSLTELGCRSSANGYTFAVHSYDALILGASQPGAIYSVNYYTTMPNAIAGTNPINAGYTTNGYTLIVKVQLRTDPTCVVYSTLTLKVVDKPLVDTMQSVITCHDYTLPPLTNGNYFTGTNGSGTPMFAGDIITQTQTLYIFNTAASLSSCTNQTSFKITIIKISDLSISSGTYCGSYTLPALEPGAGDYYTAPGGPTGGGIIIPSGTVLTTPQTVYFYFFLPDPDGCLLDAPFSINIIFPQEVAQLPNVFDCNFITLQPLTFGNYYTASGGTGIMYHAGDIINTSQTMYIYGVQTNSCPPSESHFEIVIGTSSFPNQNPSIGCGASYALPNLVVGNYYDQSGGNGNIIPQGTVLTSTTTLWVYAPSENFPNCSLNYQMVVTFFLPPLVTPPDVNQCGTYVLPALTTGNYYTKTGGPTGSGTLIANLTTISTTQKIYIYVDNGVCSNETFFNVNITPIPPIDSRASVEVCDSYTLTPLIVGNYYTAPNAGGTPLSAGNVITSTQTIYIYSSDNGCPKENNFTITIDFITGYQPSNVTACDSYILPALPINNKYYTMSGGPNTVGNIEVLAGTPITTTTTLYVFAQAPIVVHAATNCSDEHSFTITINNTPVLAPVSDVYACDSYVLPTLLVGNYYATTGGIGLIPANTTLTTSQTIYVYAETGTTPNCTIEKQFKINIYKVDTLPSITQCSSYVLPSLSVGDYYTGALGTGTLLHAGNSITTSQTIYIYGTSGYTPNCYSQSQFDVTIIPKPVANPVPIANITSCDLDGTNDGVTVFNNLSSLNSTILGTQTGVEFSVSYFNSFPDANANTNAVTSSSNTPVYVRVNNSLAPSCYAIMPISIIVNKLPEPKPVDGVVCINSLTGALLSPYLLSSGLSSTTNTINWYDGTHTIVGSGTNYLATTAGTYSVMATNNATGCVSNEVFATVTASEPPEIVSYTINEYFTGNQSITIEILGNTGNYQYQIDGGPFQDNPTFTNVMSGPHTIVVFDKNYCGMKSINAIVVNYPHFFTPNGDGVNDTWNIRDLSSQNNIISIYDRFGKLLKEIKTSGAGWDGTYNGQMMPSDDYWFTIYYAKDGEQKEFKSHFAMKR